MDACGTLRYVRRAVVLYEASITATGGWRVSTMQLLIPNHLFDPQWHIGAAGRLSSCMFVGCSALRILWAVPLPSRERNIGV